MWIPVAVFECGHHHQVREALTRRTHQHLARTRTPASPAGRGVRTPAGGGRPPCHRQRGLIRCGGFVLAKPSCCSQAVAGWVAFRSTKYSSMNRLCLTVRDRECDLTRRSREPLAVLPWTDPEAAGERHPHARATARSGSRVSAGSIATRTRLTVPIDASDRKAVFDSGRGDRSE